MKARMLFFAIAISLASPGMALAQPSGGLQIDWEVANRFRLFAQQSEFDRHVKALHDAKTKSVLGVEQELASHYPRGWAASVGDLCYGSFRGRIIERCNRDGIEENYLNPHHARIKVTVQLPRDFGNATCEWNAVIGSEEQKLTSSCQTGTDQLRAGTHKLTRVSVVARNAAGNELRGEISFKVRDILIVGIGDSIASGEGNPTRPVRLDNQGMCFRRVETGEEFYLPGRANLSINKSCQVSEDDSNDREVWNTASAGWLYSACHLSLYSYQVRTALALAIENPKISVTFIPLGCSGATINEGLLNSQASRERPTKGSQITPAHVEAQFSALSNYLRSITRGGRRRPVDLILLTIGANDMGFSGLVANVIINENPERSLAKKQIINRNKAERALTQTLRPGFISLRARLRTITLGSLDRVILTAYGNPALYDGGKPCPATRQGFDAHPAFSVSGEELANTVRFVNDKFLPALKAYAICAPGSGCTNPSVNRMTYVDAHFEAFGNHGFCAADDNDPKFDRDCFKNGRSFRTGGLALENPLNCEHHQASEFRPYAKRARWVRTANDSYFSAMTYPANGTLSTPSDIHDGLWGIEAILYGGALHPTAEGHATMADAALVAARKQLGLPAPQ